MQPHCWGDSYGGGSPAEPPNPSAPPFLGGAWFGFESVFHLLVKASGTICHNKGKEGKHHNSYQTNSDFQGFHHFWHLDLSLYSGLYFRGGGGGVSQCLEWEGPRFVNMMKKPKVKNRTWCHRDGGSPPLSCGT